MPSRTVLSTSCNRQIASPTGIFKAGSVRSDPDGSLPRPAKLFDLNRFAPPITHSAQRSHGVPPSTRRSIRAVGAATRYLAGGRSVGRSDRPSSIGGPEPQYR